MTKGGIAVASPPNSSFVLYSPGGSIGLTVWLQFAIAWLLTRLFVSNVTVFVLLLISQRLRRVLPTLRVPLSAFVPVVKFMVIAGSSENNI